MVRAERCVSWLLLGEKNGRGSGRGGAPDRAVLRAGGFMFTFLGCLFGCLFFRRFLESVLGSFLVALGVQSAEKVSKGGSIRTTFGNFSGVWPKSENLSLAVARTRYLGSEEVVFVQFLVLLLHVFSRSPPRGIRRGLALAMGRFWGRFWIPLG